MEDLLLEHYLTIKALHVISFITWMAGLFYLPRLFVYHAESQSEEVKSTLATMQHKLLRYITTPSMIAAWTLGLALISIIGFKEAGMWLHIKLLLVLLLSAFHGACAYYVKRFSINANTNSGLYYRVFNEIPTVLVFGIVFLAVIKPL